MGFTLNDIRNAVDFVPVHVTNPQGEVAQSKVPDLLGRIRKQIKQALVSDDPRDLQDVDVHLSKLFVTTRLKPGMNFREVRRADSDDALARAFFDQVLTQIDFSQRDDLKLRGWSDPENAQLAPVDAALTNKLSAAFDSGSDGNGTTELLVMGAGLILILILVAVVV